MYFPVTMGGLKEFHLQFDKPDQVYCPGQVVAGHLRICLSERQSFNNIKVEVVGKGKVHWVEIQTDPNGQPYAEPYLNSEEDISIMFLYSIYLQWVSLLASSVGYIWFRITWSRRLLSTLVLTCPLATTSSPSL